MSEVAPAAGGPAESTLVTVGDVVVTQSWVVTPSGTRPRREVSWTVTPMYQTTTDIPTWAIICAVIFFVFCLLGLLFLLAKEEKTTGHMQVTVQAPGFSHTTYVPVTSPMQANDVAGRVNYARALPC
jgi:ABC-type multidrug transport system permease subunit